MSGKAQFGRRPRNLSQVELSAGGGIQVRGGSEMVLDPNKDPILGKATSEPCSQLGRIIEHTLDVNLDAGCPLYSRRLTNRQLHMPKFSEPLLVSPGR